MHKGDDRIQINTVRRRGPRIDRLPEYFPYRDRGCSISQTCQTCPLPLCRYEHPGGLRAVLNLYRDQRIVEWRREAVSADEIGRRLHLSSRTVLRIARRLRVDAEAKAAA